MNDDERRRLADHNVITAFALVERQFGDPGGGTRRFGRVEAIAAGSDIRFFNRVMALDADTRVSDVLAAASWIEARGWPFIIQVRGDLDQRARPILEARGWRADPWASPVLVLDPIPASPAAPKDLVLKTGGAELHNDFIGAVPSGSMLPRALGPGFAADEHVRLAVGYLDGVPVARAAAIGSASTVGIYVVGTAEAARRRGFGRAVTWAAIDAAVAAWQGTVAVLQSSEMGVPVYASMGFAEVCRYVEYERPST